MKQFDLPTNFPYVNNIDICFISKTIINTYIILKTFYIIILNSSSIHSNLFMEIFPLSMQRFKPIKLKLYNYQNIYIILLAIYQAYSLLIAA